MTRAALGIETSSNVVRIYKPDVIGGADATSYSDAIEFTYRPDPVGHFSEIVQPTAALWWSAQAVGCSRNILGTRSPQVSRYLA